MHHAVLRSCLGKAGPLTIPLQDEGVCDLQLYSLAVVDIELRPGRSSACGEGMVRADSWLSFPAALGRRHPCRCQAGRSSIQTGPAVLPALQTDLPGDGHNLGAVLSDGVTRQGVLPAHPACSRAAG